MCYLIAFVHVCSAFTLVRRHRQPRDSVSCREDFVFAIFNLYVPFCACFVFDTEKDTITTSTLRSLLFAGTNFNGFHDSLI